MLYKKRGVNIKPLICGGDQEYGLRAGTENLPAVAGLAKAVSLIDKKEGFKVMKLRDYFLDKVSLILPVKINGPYFAKASKGRNFMCAGPPIQTLQKNPV